MSDKYLIECNDILHALWKVAANTYHGAFGDPPYGLSFMGKRWDHGVPSVAVWREVLRVVKPGGMLLAFGGTRTFHRLMCNIEDAGWEIRDTLMWVYGSGFPKSYDISKGIDKLNGAEREIVARHIQSKQTRKPAASLNVTHDLKRGNKTLDWQYDVTAPATQQARQWDGYGTALKPSYEPIVLAMKPIEGGFANNALEWGVGGLNVGGCRVGNTVETWPSSRSFNSGISGGYTEGIDKGPTQSTGTAPAGRWPANLILSYPETQYELAHGNLSSSQLDELEIWFIDNDIDQESLGGDDPVLLEWEWEKLPDELKGMFIKCDNEGEREVLSGFPVAKPVGKYKDPTGDCTTDNGFNASSYVGSSISGVRRRSAQYSNENNDSASRFFYHAKTSSRERHLGNINCRHPTLKPIRLTHYLAKLILPPPHVNSKLLQFFSGAGSEAIGALKAGWSYVHGIDNDSQYCEWANARILAALECEGFDWPAVPRKPREPDITTFDPSTMSILDYLKD